MSCYFVLPILILSLVFDSCLIIVAQNFVVIIDYTLFGEFFLGLWFGFDDTLPHYS